MDGSTDLAHFYLLLVRSGLFLIDIYLFKQG